MAEHVVSGEKSGSMQSSFLLLRLNSGLDTHAHILTLDN